LSMGKQEKKKKFEVPGILESARERSFFLQMFVQFFFHWPWNVFLGFFWTFPCPLI